MGFAKVLEKPTYRMHVAQCPQSMGVAVGCNTNFLSALSTSGGGQRKGELLHAAHTDVDIVRLHLVVATRHQRLLRHQVEVGLWYHKDQPLHRAHGPTEPLQTWTFTSMAQLLT